MHPLLEAIRIQELGDNTDAIRQAIEGLGLTVKYDESYKRFIVKYPENLKFSSNPVIRKSRGVVIDPVRQLVVCPSLEGAVSLDEFKKNVQWSDVVIEQCVDGTMFNVYYDNDEWRLATKYHLHPESNYYRSPKSFFQLFEDAVDFKKLTNALDKECSYVFLLCHPENRNVTLYNKPLLYHIETSHVNTQERIFTRINVDGIAINTCGVLQYCNRPIQLKEAISSYDDISSYIDTLHWSQRGVMLFSKDRAYRCCVLNPRYETVRSYVSGHSSYEFICMKKIKGEIDDTTWTSMTDYYPEFEDAMCQTIRAYDSFVTALYEMYIRMRVKKETVDPPKEWKTVLHAIHTDYLHRRYHSQEPASPSNRFSVTVQFVREKVIGYDTRLIYSWMKQYLPNYRGAN
jgi:hypothetical protein